LSDLNEAPVVNNQGFAVNENSANGTSVGTVLANDQDTGDALTYSIIAGNTGNAFAIDASTGEITVNDATQLDFETTPSFGLTVQVQDNGTGTLTDTATVVINLGNVYDTPPSVVTNTGLTLSEGAIAGIDATALQAIDIELPATGIRYTIIEAPVNGQLELASAPGMAVTGFTQTDIDAGLLRYVHDGSDTTVDSFSFNVDDGQGNRVTEQVFNIAVTPIDDTAPLIINNAGASVDSNGSVSVTSGMLSVADTQPAENITYTLTRLPSGGNLFLNGIPLGVNDTFTQSDIDAGRLVYHHAGSATTDSFAFSIDDGMGNQVSNVSFAVSVNADAVVPLVADDTGTAMVLPPPLVPAPGVLNTPPAAQFSFQVPEPFVPAGGGSHGNPGNSAAVADSAPEPAPQVVTPALPPTADVGAPEYVDVSLEATIFADNEVPQPDTGADTLSDSLWLSLDRMHGEMNGSELASPWVMAATRGMVWTFSAGFLAWALRAGSLLAATLSSMPMWRWIDPLPILPVKRRERDRRKAKMCDEAEAEAKAYRGMAAVLDGTGEDERR
ncbi:MAG: cadherin-like domain-containing protein, partial [Thiogranum sp.]